MFYGSVSNLVFIWSGRTTNYVEFACQILYTHASYSHCDWTSEKRNLFILYIFLFSTKIEEKAHTLVNK